MRKFQFIEEAYISPEIPKEYVEIATVNEIRLAWLAEVREIAKVKHPSVMLWEYDPSYILPARVKTEDFIANQSTPVPLVNMFELAKYVDIPKAFDDARSRKNSKAVSNILSRVAKTATAHFRDVWREYADIEFSLVENGDYIEIGVKDAQETDFNFSQRSDGFKRFVTFLLLVSVKFKMNKLSNTLLLIDEPDIALHPSGSKYLRKELLKISQENYMVYSTHSPFMIDPEKIERHLIVKKTKEVTSASPVSRSTIRDEEVIFNALGTSIFETLKETNILFEGWFDKKMFQVALTRIPNQYRGLGDRLRGIGYAHATGVKAIEYITPTIEMSNKKLLIVSDCDALASQYQKSYIDNKGYGRWVRYDELVPGTTALTGEDCLKAAAFKSAIKTIVDKYPDLSAMPDGALDGAVHKLKFIESWMARGGVPKDEIKTAIFRAKEQIFAELKTSHFSDDYYVLLEAIANEASAI